MNVVEVAANIATIKETVEELRAGSEGCNQALEILRKFDVQLAELIEVQVFIAMLEGNTAEFVADAFSLTVRQVNGIHTRRRIMATLRTN